MWLFLRLRLGTRSTSPQGQGSQGRLLGRLFGNWLRAILLFNLQLQRKHAKTTKNTSKYCKEFCKVTAVRKVVLEHTSFLGLNWFAQKKRNTKAWTEWDRNQSCDNSDLPQNFRPPYPVWLTLAATKKWWKNGENQLIPAQCAILPSFREKVAMRSVKYSSEEVA